MAIVDVDYVCLYNMSRIRIRSSKGSKLRSLVALFQFHSAVTVGRVIVYRISRQNVCYIPHKARDDKLHHDTKIAAIIQPKFGCYARLPIPICPSIRREGIVRGKITQANR